MRENFLGKEKLKLEQIHKIDAVSQTKKDSFKNVRTTSFQQSNQTFEEVFQKEKERRTGR